MEYPFISSAQLKLERDRRLAALDAAIASGIADAEAGRVKPIDTVRTELQVLLGKKARTPA